MFSSWWSGKGASGAGNFTCDIGEPLPNGRALILGGGSFTLHNGTSPVKGTSVPGGAPSSSSTGSAIQGKKGYPVSVFVCSDPSAFSAATAAIKRLRTLRHPSVVTFIEARLPPELDGNAPPSATSVSPAVATEPVLPLLIHLERLEDEEEEVQEFNDDDEEETGNNKNLAKRNVSIDNYIAWGILQVFRAVAFLHEAGMVHGCLHAGCIFVTPERQWKLFGFERTISNKQGQNDQFQGPLSPSLSKYAPPESKHSSGRLSVPTDDSWGLGCTIWEVFNGPLGAANELGKLGKIPKKIQPTYMECVAKNPSKRPDPAEKVKVLRAGGQYLKNDLIDTMIFLEEFQIKDETEKTRFFSGLTNEKLDTFPKDVCTKKILPELLKAFDYSNAGAQIIAPVFKIGRLLPSEEYQERIVPCLVKLFESSDRNARYKLLCQIESFVQHLSNKIVNDKVFPQIQNGFLDQEPAIREKTVIAVIHLAPKLNFSNLDECVVIKHFSRLLKDEQAGIRTNTTVCLGKIARYLHHTTRQKVLAAAFGVKLKDPFPPARIAGINAFAATQQYYSLTDTSIRVLPMICSLMVDPEKPVRDQAFKVGKGFMDKLEQVSENPELKQEMEAEVASTNSNQVISAASGWASWAVGAIGAKFYKSATPPPGTTQPPQNQTNANPTSKDSSIPAPTNKPSDRNPNVSSNISTKEKAVSKGGSMQLGRGNSSNNTLDLLTGDDVKDKDNGDGWGDDDDFEDWGSLEEEIASKASIASGSKHVEKKQQNDDFWGSANNSLQDSSTNVRSSTIKTNQMKEIDQGGWDDWNENSIEASSSASSQDEKRKQREEKKLARQKELEAKRAARKGGAMKLGSKMS